MTLASGSDEDDVVGVGVGIAVGEGIGGGVGMSSARVTSSAWAASSGIRGRACSTQIRPSRRLPIVL
jgi:hypothetical protein